MSKTGIEYGDVRWNPIRGCKGIGCAVKEKCWAKSMNNRFHYIKDFSKPELNYKMLTSFKMPKKPSRILTCFMGDFFGKGVRALWRQKVYNVIKTHPEHTYFILTKHPERISNEEVDLIPGNVFIGVTVNSENDLWRLSELVCLKGVKRFVSFEPLLSYIDVAYYFGFRIDWIIIGGMQLGREPKPRTLWIEAILRHADVIPVWMKNNLKGIWPGRFRKEYPK